MPAVEAVLSLFARRLLRASAKGDVGRVLQLLARQEPALAAVLRDGLINAFVTAARAAARPVLPTGIAAGGGPPLRPPFGPRSLFADPEPTPPIRFPGTEAAANWLRNRDLLTPEDFANLSVEARRAAFTVARVSTLDAVQKVRDAVGRSVTEGRTLREFRGDVREALEDSRLSPAQVETIYRTNVGQAQAAGQRAVLAHPLVQSEVPYLLFTATHDSRTRPTHLELEKWGQNGTAVYRADDPIWDVLWPPMEWGCRCNVIPLSIEDAAAHGSREAQRWLRTGEPPAEPVWAARPYPVTPPAGWPDHRGVAAVV